MNSLGATSLLLAAAAGLYSQYSDVSDCANFYDGELIVCYNKHRAELDQIASLVACQHDAPWHLPWVSHRFKYPPADAWFAYDCKNETLDVYVVDSWVDVEHPQFQGRVKEGPAFADGKHFHGTHVAGLVTSACCGLNRNVTVVAVQVLDANGQTPWSRLVQALNWLSRQPKPGVINLSIAGGPSPIVDSILTLMVRKGWRIVAAAGNSAADACNYTPGRCPAVLTVGSLDLQGNMSSFSNRGKCVNIWAPGSDILSTYPQNLMAYASGTSMAAPIVAAAWAGEPKLESKETFIGRLSQRIDKNGLAALYTRPEAICPLALDRRRFRLQ